MRVAVELDRLGLTYVRQYAFRDVGGRFACNCDFYFPTLNAVLEVNGTYWHADPRVYAAQINAMQQRCVKQYRRKLELLAARGVRVVEVWEEDLKRDIAEAMFMATSQLIDC